MRGRIPAIHYRSVHEALQAVLQNGKDRAKTAAEIAAMTGLDHRQITREIQRMRLLGVPVCASSGETPGYWISEDAKEIEQYCKTLDRRLKNIRMTREAVGGVLAAMTGQMDFADAEVNHEEEAGRISKETV